MNNAAKESTQDVKVIHHSGRLDTNTSPEFEKLVNPFLESEQFLVINLSQCPYLSSIGIRILLKSAKKMASKQGQLYLTGLTPAVSEVIEMAGLHKIFQIADNDETAINNIRHLQGISPEKPEWISGNQTFIFNQEGIDNATALIWKNDGIAGYNELGFSVGIGCPAETGFDFQTQSGLFVTTGNCAGYIPDNHNFEPEFRVSSEPEKTGIMVAEALSFGNKPSGRLELKGGDSISLKKLYDALGIFMQEISSKPNGIMMLVLVSRNEKTLSISFAILHNQDLFDVADMYGLAGFQNWKTEGKHPTYFNGITFLLSELTVISPDQQLNQILKSNLNIENILDIQILSQDQEFNHPLIWIFCSTGFSFAATGRLAIEAEPDVIIEPYMAFLMRRLYTDSARIKIEELHGGYSAKTYQVTSFDQEGRKMRPTVLKTAPRQVIMRESDRCRQYALPYIFNNSAVVLGAEYYDDTGALRYNFVGIGGEKSQLKWLTHYYHHADTELIESLYDKIFIEILKPWHGQPVKKTIYPYKDHDPTLTFFPGISKAASDLFSISPDEKHIRIDEINRPILNPYWFLKHEFVKRREHGFEYFSGICHGDLNMQNILLDENMNIYLIDFSETRPRSVISDYARLEAILLVDNAPVENAKDLEDYLEFIAKFYSSSKLSETTEAVYNGRHQEKVSRNIRLSLKLRKYALDSVGGNPDAVPYYLALLEWVLPIVCWTIPDQTKRLSMIVAALVSEQILNELNP